MKKITAMALCFVLLFAFHAMPVFAEGISDVVAEITSDRQVTVSGFAGGAPGRQVSVGIIDPDGNIEYANSTLSGSSGSFRFSYAMTNDARGKYIVTINAAGASSPVTSCFYYGANNDQSNLTVNARIDTGMFVTVNGIISSGSGKRVSVGITDPDGKLAYVNDTESMSGGMYEFIFLLDNAAYGRYSVKVGAVGVSLPSAAYFDCVADEGLKALSVNNAILIPVFRPETSSYASYAGAATESVTVTPTAYDNEAVIKVNGMDVQSGKPSGKISIGEGSNMITVTVTGWDGVTVKTYMVSVIREEPSPSGITVAAELGRHRQVKISGAVDMGAGKTVSVMITDPHGGVEYLNSSLCADGGVYEFSYALTNSARGRYEVTVGTEGLSAPVKAWFDHDPGNADLKSLKMGYASLTPEFSPDRAEYSVSVGHGTKHVSVTPIAVDPDATVSVNGQSVESDAASDPVSLNEGSNNINIIVKAQDGTLKTYTITVDRGEAPPNMSGDANLSSLLLSTGEFIDPDHFYPDTAFYYVEVDNFTPAISMTPTASDSNASIAVDGNSVESGGSSGPIALGAGDTTVNIVVTAQDGTQKTYVVLIRQL